jgi:hypothetical protein
LQYLSAFASHLAGSIHKDESFGGRVIGLLENSIKSGDNSWFSGLRIIVNELSQSPADEKLFSTVEGQAFAEKVIRTWQEFFTSHVSRKETANQAWERMCDTLLNGTHNAVCDVLESMMTFLGFEVHSHRHERGKPDLLAFSVFGKKYLVVMEVKTKEQGNELARGDIDQVSGHKAGYQSEYPDHIVIPLVFTNKSKVSDTAEEKAKHNARILLAPVLVTFMRRLFDAMEKSSMASDPSIRLSLTEKIPGLEAMVPILTARETPMITQKELDSFLVKK